MMPKCYQCKGILAMGNPVYNKPKEHKFFCSEKCAINYYNRDQYIVLSKSNMNDDLLKKIGYETKGD